MPKANSKKKPDPDKATGKRKSKPAAESKAKRQIKELEETVSRLEGQLEEKNDLYVRTLAELDNTRKRATREVEQAHKYALDRFATELLGVRDSLELGMKAAEAPDADTDTVKEGMAITLKQLTQVMEKFGIRELEPTGEPFDPEFHEAIAMNPSEDQAPNTVLEVVQKGFVLNGRVLRAARVVVAGAPETDKTA